MYNLQHDFANCYDICVSPTTTNVCYNPNSVFSSIIAYHRLCDSSYTTDATADSTWVPECIPVFLWVRVAQSVVFYVVFCGSFFVFFPFSFVHCWSFSPFLLSIVLSVSCDIWLLITHLIFVKLFFGMYFVLWVVVD